MGRLSSYLFGTSSPTTQSTFVKHNVINLYFLHTAAGDSIKLVEKGFGHANCQAAMEEEDVEKVTKKNVLKHFWAQTKYKAK